LQVAAQVTGEYADGVWLVELSPVTDEQRIPQVIAFVLGVKEEPGRPLAQTLAAFARPRRMLLVLDNCEHLIAGCADIARQLLLAAPHLKVLASSREPLHVSGEARFPVPALDIPTEAVRLFVDRAASVHQGFQLTPSNEPAIAAICKRLDGIPLAIELAAARASTLPAERIAEQLDNLFRVLNRGDRAAPTRQQTLRASIDWSHDLLSIPERILLRRLAVFSGGWTLEAAEAVVAGGDVPKEEVVDLLTQLVEKSLVELDERGERFRLLETMRQYAMEMLQASGGERELRDRHALHYLDFAENARKGLASRQAGFWYVRLDAERENILAAHRWCDHTPDGAALGLRFASAMRVYWLNRGLVGVGFRFTVDALARTRPDERSPKRCRVLFDAGQIACFQGRYREALPYLEESLAIAKELGDKYRIAAAQQPLSMVCIGLGDMESARRHAEGAVEILGDGTNVGELAAAMVGLGQYRRASGQLDGAEKAYQQALTLAGGHGNEETQAIILLNLAITSLLRGAFDTTRAMTLEVLGIEDRIGSTHATQSVLEVCAALASATGDYTRVARYYGAAEAIAAQTGLHRDAADEAFLVPLIDRARAALGAETFDAGERLGGALSHTQALEEARAWLQSPAGALSR
jgi:non-specific serine/threonine protein kinase